MSNLKPLVIDAGALYSPFERIAPARLVVQQGAIVDVGFRDRISVPPGAARLDAGGYTIVPGFVDTHVHGSGGRDVMEGTFDALDTISRTLARFGTTSFLATTVSSPQDLLTETVEKLAGLMKQQVSGAELLGIHMEGPFISPDKRGAHDSNDVAMPDPEALSRWIRASNASIRLITVAPELEGVGALIARARQSDVVVAMGHSNASHDQAVAAADAGVCYAVHTFNAMRAFGHRDSGIVGAVLSDDRVFAEIIADGVHVAPEVLRIFARCKPVERFLLITDAVSATGMPDGRYRLGTREVEHRNGVCRDFEGRLAGSTLTQDQALRNFIKWTGVRLQDALLGLTVNPSKAIGIRKGVLEPGADADFVVLNNDLQIHKTFAGGREVYSTDWDQCGQN